MMWLSGAFSGDDVPKQTREREWWELQIMIPEPAEQPLIEQLRIPRRDLIIQACRYAIENNLTASYHDVEWSLTNFPGDISPAQDEFVVDLRRPQAGPAIGFVRSITETVRRSGYDLARVLFHLPSQRVYIEQHHVVSADPSSPARALQSLLRVATKALGQGSFYGEVDVAPVLEQGSFVEWWRESGGIRKLTIEFRGRNMADDHAPDFLNDVEEMLAKPKKAFSSPRASLAVTDPTLDDAKAAALDRGVAVNRIGITASAKAGKPWSAARRHKAKRRKFSELVSLFVNLFQRPISEVDDENH